MNEWLVKYILIVFCVLFFSNCRKEIPVENEIPETTSSKPFISISFPEYGDKYLPGEIINITWESTKSINSVTIELIKQDQSQGIIASRISNNGYYLWKIPNNIIQSGNYKIKISSSTNPGVFNYSGIFSISLQ